MDVRPGGVKAVHHSNVGTVGNWTALPGEVTRAENLPTEPINQAHTKGEYQSGDTSAPNIFLNDHDGYATIRNLAVGANRAKTFFAIEFYDGTILKTKQPVFPKASLAPKGVRSEGDSEWLLSWNQGETEFFEVIASLT